MKKNVWERFYENRIFKLLVHQPLRFVSKLFSDGGFHFVVFIAVFIITYYWYRSNIDSSKIAQHTISFDISENQSPDHYFDSLTVYDIDFVIDSDSLLKKTKKYKSKVSVRYAYDWYGDYNGDHIWGTNKYKGSVDTCELHFFHKPYLNDLYVDQDSVNYPNPGDTLVYKTNITKVVNKDSSLLVKVVPAKENLTQNINFYSNELGLNEGNPYYNYFISLPFFSLATDTQNFKGGQSISIQIGDLVIMNGFYHNVNRNITYQFIYPEPDVLNNGFIYYHSSEKLQKIRENHGVIIQATDLDALNKSNKENIVYSVLVGTGVALALDILIQLFRELRNVNDKYDSLLKTEDAIYTSNERNRRRKRRNNKKNQNTTLSNNNSMDKGSENTDSEKS